MSVYLLTSPVSCGTPALPLIGFTLLGFFLNHSPVASAYKDVSSRKKYNDGYNDDDEFDDDEGSGYVTYTDNEETGGEVEEENSGDYYYYYSLGEDGDEVGGGSQRTSPPHGTTLCRRQQLEATVRNQSGNSIYIPQCTNTGQYVPLQCSSNKAWPSQKVECWCVNRQGHEERGTRVLMRGGSQTSRSPTPPQCQHDVQDKDTIRYNQNGVGEGGVIFVGEEPKSNRERGRKGDVQTGEDLLVDENGSDRTGASTNQLLPNSNSQSDKPQQKPVPADRTGLVAGLVCGILFCLLLALLLVLFVIYRLRKKDEGSYALEEPKASSPTIGYNKSHDREFFA